MRGATSYVADDAGSSVEVVIIIEEARRGLVTLGSDASIVAVVLDKSLLVPSTDVIHTVPLSPEPTASGATTLAITPGRNNLEESKSLRRVCISFFRFSRSVRLDDSSL